MFNTASHFEDMQIIDSTPFGVRSAYRRLTSEAALPTIHLFPMVHVGDEEFYKDVTNRVSKMDLVLTEGVKTNTSFFITLCYRMIVKNPKFGLVKQPEILPGEIPAQVINIDVSGAQFKERWRRTKWITRFGLPFIAPFLGVYFRFFGSREELTVHLGREFLQSREDILQDSKMWEGAEGVLLHWRDQQLLQEIGKQLKAYPNIDVNIAIVYGAAHMKTIIKYLVDHRGYKISKAEWLDLIKL